MENASAFAPVWETGRRFRAKDLFVFFLEMAFISGSGC